VRRLTRPGLHAVGGVSGLALQVADSGARSWVLRVRVGGARRYVGLGAYPEVSLSEARAKASAVKARMREGADPVAERRAARAAQARALTFQRAAEACYAAKAVEFRNPKHAAQWIGTLRQYAFPVIGALPVADIELAHIVAVLEPLWIEKTETATRVRQRIEAVLNWATVSGHRRGDNPARWRGNLDALLPKPRKLKRVEHHAALHCNDVAAFMATLRQQSGMAARALEFAVLTAARSGEVRGMRWGEVDFDARMWTVPAERIKSGKRHRVPLSDDALRLLEAVPRALGTDLVFWSVRNRALSDNALTKVLKRMGVGVTAHGFRSTFKDWARTHTAYADEVSELALAHVSNDATRAAYARDELMPQRERLMRDWARWCRTVPEGAVLPLRRPA
jgi:integrase